MGFVDDLDHNECVSGIAKITSLDVGFAMSEVSLVLKMALILRRLMNQRQNGSQVVRQAYFQLPAALSLVVQSLTILQQLPVMTHDKKSKINEANHRKNS